MTKSNHLKFDVLKLAIFLCLFFAYSYCSVWCYKLFEFSIIEILYGGVLCFLMVVAVVRMKIRVGYFTVLMLAMVAVMVLRRASVTYLTFYLTLTVLVLSNKVAAYAGYISKVINFFSCIHLLGMAITWLMPQLYAEVFLPAFGSVDYFYKLRTVLLNRSYCFGFTGQASHFAGFMVLGLANRLTLYRDHKPHWKERNLIFLLLSFLGLYLSGKRAHFGFCIAAAVIIYYYQVYVTNNRRMLGSRFTKVLFLSVGGMFALWLISLMVEGTLLNEIFDTIYSLGDASADITTGRVVFWSTAIQLFLQNPLFGIGWKRFYNIQFYGYRYNVHNIYLQLLCEVGLIGAVLFFTFFISALIFTLRRLKSGTVGTTHKRVLLFSLFYQIFFLMYGFTGNPLYDASYYIFYFIIVAMALSIPVTKSNSTEAEDENRNHNLS